MKVICFVIILLTVLSFPIYAQEEAAEAVQEIKPVAVDGIVAVVDNEIILRSEVLLLVRETLQMNQVTSQISPEEFQEYYSNTLNALIVSKVEVAKAREDTLVSVTDEEVEMSVNERIDNLINQAGSEAAVEQTFGSSVKRIREIITSRVREQMLISRLRNNKMEGITISRSEIEVFYETFKDSMPEQPETYDLNHILKIPVASGPEVKRKEALLDSVKQLILNGEDFAKFAEQHSEDPGSNKNGGEYGWIEYGQFVPEFENAVRELNEGDISDIVRTNFGLHLIQVLGKRPDSFRARHILLMAQPTDEDAEAVIDTLNALRERAINGEDFGALSGEYSDDGQVRKDKGRLGRISVQQMTQLDPQFATVAKTLKVGEISKPFKTPFGYHVFKVNAYTPAHKINLKDDYERLKSIAQQDKQQREYQVWLEDAKKEVFIDVKRPTFNDTVTVKKK